MQIRLATKTSMGCHDSITAVGWMVLFWLAGFDCCFCKSKKTYWNSIHKSKLHPPPPKKNSLSSLISVPNHQDYIGSEYAKMVQFQDLALSKSIRHSERSNTFHTKLQVVYQHDLSHQICSLELPPPSKKQLTAKNHGYVGFFVPPPK